MDIQIALECLFDKLSEKQNRVFKVCVSPAIQNYAKRIYTSQLCLKYNTIDFLQLCQEKKLKETTPMKSTSEFIRSFFINLISLHALLGPLITVSNILIEFSQYKLCKKDISLLNSRLNFHTKPSKYYHKLKRVIIISDLSKLCDQDMDFLKCIIEMIRKKYLSTTAVVILESVNSLSDINVDDNSQINVLIETNKSFVFNNNSYKFQQDKIELLNRIGIDYVDLISNNEKLNADKIVEQIINKLFESARVSKTGDIEHFLNLCSLLFEEFTLKDIETIEKISKLSSSNYVDLTLKSDILNERNRHYKFHHKFIRSYYQNNANLNLTTYEQLYNYLCTTYPDRYADIAIVSQCLKIDDNLVLSCNIMAYYQENATMENYKKNYIEVYLRKTKLGKLILELNAAYNADPMKLPNIKTECYKLIVELKYSKLESYAKAASIAYASRILYEVENDIEKLKFVEQKFRDIIVESRFLRYPTIQSFRYILDYISFTTCIENCDKVDKIREKLSFILNKLSDQIVDKNLAIKYFRLGNAIYPYDYHKAKNMTQQAYLLTEDYPLEHILSCINYSTSLCLCGDYVTANSVLNEDIILTMLEKDDFKDKMLQLSVLNNYIIIQFCIDKNKRKLYKKFNDLKTKVSHTLTSDSYIIFNNYICSSMLNNKYHTHNNIIMTKHILQCNDKYHVFFLNHNLITWYYINNDKEMFNNILKSIEIPNLLSGYEEFFKDKFNWLGENWGYCLEKLESELNIWSNDIYQKELFYYSKPYLFGFIERWFE